MLWIWNLRSPPFISVNTIQSASLVSYAYAKLTYNEKHIKIKSPFPKKTMISYQLLKRADNLPYVPVYNTHFFRQKCFSKFNVCMIHRILCFMNSCLDSYNYANNASCIQLFGYTWERCFLCDTGSSEEKCKYSQRELSLWPGY